jgi:hypothetical protein
LNCAFWSLIQRIMCAESQSEIRSAYDQVEILSIEIQIIRGLRICWCSWRVVFSKKSKGVNHTNGLRTAALGHFCIILRFRDSMGGPRGILGATGWKCLV